MTERPKKIEITEPVTINMNGTEVTVQKGELLIEAAERNGEYIPRFCHHSRMNPVGMCRMCLVEVDTGRGPALQPSCMIECGDGMTVNTETEGVKKAQDGVLEFLLVNHPLDCPVCDKGGECPLQDQTVAFGPGESRWVEEKRHYEKPIEISETVMLDRERCILCDRCTRFADEVAGDPLIHFIDRGSSTQVNTFPNEPFSSYFSGNTVQICPVGALTAKPFRFKARPWDLDEVESTCTTCSVGCRQTIEASRDDVLRFQGVDSDPVNWGWLCDKGRFGFESINSEERLTVPLAKTDGAQSDIRWNDALTDAAAMIQTGLDRSGPESIAVLGGARLTNESAYAWAKLAKGVIGTDNCDAQLGDELPADLVMGLPRATVDEVCAPGGTIIYLGPDPKEDLGVLYIRLKHAVVEDGAKLIELAPRLSGLSPYATAALTYEPGRAAALVAAICSNGTPPADLDPVLLDRAKRIVSEADGDVRIVIGRPSVAESAATIVDAVAELQRGLTGATFLPALRRGNVFGALDMGLAPGFLPGRVRRSEGASWFSEAWGTVPSADGLDATGILTAAAEGKIEVLVLLGADPLSDFPDSALAERALLGARKVIALDRFNTRSTTKADLVFPVSGQGEVTGTTTNLEGRVSVLGKIVTAPGSARTDWEIAHSIGAKLGADLGFDSTEEIWNEIETLSVTHAGLTTALLASPEAIDGVVVPLPAPIPVEVPADQAESDQSETGQPEAGDQASADSEAPDSETADSQGSATAEVDAGVELIESPAPATFVAPKPVNVPPTDSYSLRLVATRRSYGDGTMLKHASALNGLVGTTTLRLNPSDFDKAGVAEGGRARLTSGQRSVSMPVASDSSVPKGHGYVESNMPDVDLGAILDMSSHVTDVRLEVGS